MQKVIIVEDDADGMGAELMHRLAIIVKKFPTVEIILVGTMAALHVAIQELPHPDIIFLDLGLPDSAWEKTIREVDGLEKTGRVIIVTGHPEYEVRKRLANESVEIIEKTPAMWSKLIEAICRALVRTKSPNMDTIESNIRKLRELITEDAS